LINHRILVTIQHRILIAIQHRILVAIQYTLSRSSIVSRLNRDPVKTSSHVRVPHIIQSINVINPIYIHYILVVVEMMVMVEMTSCIIKFIAFDRHVTI